MPIDVDVQERLDELALATLAVVRREGIAAVTIRSVAREMGRSTTVVTNYLPTRAELVLNAFRHGSKVWDDELATALDGLTGPERLQRALEWWVSSEPLDDALRQLWLEIVITAGSDERFAELVSDLGAADRDRVEEFFGAGAAAEPLVDAFLLTLRGFWISAQENPGEWTSERGLRAVRAAAAALSTPPSAPDAPPF